MDRRALLQWMVATGGIEALSRLGGRDLRSLGEGAHARLRDGGTDSVELLIDEVATLASAAETIIPRTNTPGASDAGVAAFIQLMLAEWYPAADVARFKAGLAALERASTTRFGAA